jgi:Uma2 family endonuclease
MTLSLEFTEVSFPDSDGKPMAENTEQFQWIVLIKENLEILFADEPHVFVAGDLLWYPIQSRLISPVAPDAMVAFGRPKGRRGSYKQWEEENIAPQVVFEILSPCNHDEEMARKLEFYDTYGVEEYYQYDPDKDDLKGWRREGSRLDVISKMEGWVSPRLGIRFEQASGTLRLYYSNGQPFRSPVELSQQVEQERQRADEERQRADEAVQSLTSAITRLLSMGLTPAQIAEALGLTLEQVQTIQGQKPAAEI